MNKILTKVATLALGAAMAVGVGVAVGSKKASEAKAASATETFSHTAISGMATAAAASTSGTYSVFTITVDGLTSSGFNASESVRVYKGASITIAVSTGNITSATLTCTANGTTKYGPGCLTGDGWEAGTAKDGTWTGSAASFTLTASSNQARISDFSITYEAGGEVTTYTITYDANGGTGTMEDTTSANPAVASCTFTAPEGKTFGRWNTEDDGSGDDYAVGATPGANLDLYAIWVDKPTCVTLDKIGTSLSSTANTTMATVDIADGSDSYTLNYLQCKKQNDAMLMAKSVGAFISNATEMPGNITGVDVYINSGASGSTTYDVAFGKTAYTEATTGIGAVNITGGNHHEFEADISDARYFCISLGNANNGQVLKIVINYEASDPSKDTLNILLNDATPSPATVRYSSGGLYYANDKDGNDVNAEWSSSNTSIFTVGKNGNNVCYVTPVAPGTANIIAKADGYNDGIFVLTIDAGAVETVTVSGVMTKTSYYVGEVWSPAGLTVTADYEYGYHGDVTSSASWNYSPESPATSVTSVVATATYNDVSGSSTAQSVTVTRTNPIQAIYTKSSGASVDVYGYYVGFLDGTGPVIMDGDYGIVIYNKSADVSDYTVNETILHVTGSVSIYKGLYEIGSATISVASGTFDHPDTPVIYSTTGNETADYASRLTTVTGTATLTSGSFDDAAGTNDIKLSFTVGTKTVQVFYKKAAQTADADAFAAIKDAVANSTEITIKGFTGWYDGFQVQMNGVVEAAESYTAEEFAQYLLDETDAVCEGYTEGDNNHDALVNVWNKLQNPTDPDQKSYPFLPAAEKTVLGEADADEEGSTIEQAIARYEHICSAYGLAQFIEGRAEIPVKGSYAPSYVSTLDSSSSITIIVIVAVASMTLLGVTLVLRKRKHQ